MEERKTRTGRDEWRKRIERWRENRLSAEAFAAELGTKPATLKFWKYRLEQGALGKVAPDAKSVPQASLKGNPRTNGVAQVGSAAAGKNARR